MADSSVHISRGRRQYLADLQLLQAAAVLNELTINEVTVVDPSEYPSNHVFFCAVQSSRDEKTSSLLSPIARAVTENGPVSIEQLLRGTLAAVARSITAVSIPQDVGLERSAEGDFDEYDDNLTEFNDPTITPGEVIDHHTLHSDFTEIVAYGYRPGFVPIDIDEYVLSVSCPTIKLADDIPTRALMAWDRRLLAPSQHLTLLVHGLNGVYPILEGDGALCPHAVERGRNPQFKVGLTSSYKPQREHVVETIRVSGRWDKGTPQENVNEEQAQETDNMTERRERVGFDHFNLSSPMETLLNLHFMRLLKLRLKYDLGWAGVEVLLWEADRTQQKAEDIMKSMRPLPSQAIQKAEDQENELSSRYNLPPDPLLSRGSLDCINLPLLAFSYLLRRLTLCPRYCLVCHDRLQTDYVALKPYVCNSPLCTYQYYHLNWGPSLEYEICSNPDTVDVLVSLAYIAASAEALKELLPIGIGLRVPAPDKTALVNADGLCEYDKLTYKQMCASIVMLIDQLPPIELLKVYLENPINIGNTRARLRDFDHSIPEATWSILRWCIASCTAHMEEMKTEEERIRNIGAEWRQFRFTIGAPDAEAKFQKALELAQAQDENVLSFPCLYIIRHGLWYKDVANGRLYGDGVYFAKEASISVKRYAQQNTVQWKNSSIGVSQCITVAQIVNRPQSFVYNRRYFVVDDTRWILCRYLLVKGSSADTAQSTLVQGSADTRDIPFIRHDPKSSFTFFGKQIQVPEPSYTVEKLLSDRRSEPLDVQYDEEDLSILEGRSPVKQTQPVDDWTHDPEWVRTSVKNVLPLPGSATRKAKAALQRAFKTMLREQQEAKSMKELGWYIPPDMISGNQLRWIVELHSFDEDLPIAQIMKMESMNSLVVEITFPRSFPASPPFFRVLKPRFLPFTRDGEDGHTAHITAVQPSDRRISVYGTPHGGCISAILRQIRLVVSSLRSHPNRLAKNWSVPYNMPKALRGYKKVASMYGWKSWEPQKAPPFGADNRGLRVFHVTLPAAKDHLSMALEQSVASP
ncbi:hypothetical protein IEO21_07397 [Rhodonia placenta]|uniref:UBC core domain-containing protein n=1 Tax=Rhodonia placenta TaxID=104341 RepID=A0A8H7TZQ0_9APHY|nr:hypothetical protein IEO21_07397 [Postia placenta]